MLRGVLHNLGVAEEQMDTVCVTLDKWDKIGTEGVLAELEEKQLDAAARQKLGELLDGGRTIEQAEQLWRTAAVHRAAQNHHRRRKRAGRREV